MNKKSRAFVMLAKSVVTRLLIFPTRLLLRSSLGSDFATSSAGLPSVAFFPLVEITLSELPCKVVSPLEDSCLSRSSGVEAPAGVGFAVDSRLPAMFFVSAFIRIRRECSKMSCVKMLSVLTSVLVCGASSTDTEVIVDMNIPQ